MSGLRLLHGEHGAHADDGAGREEQGMTSYFDRRGRLVEVWESGAIVTYNHSSRQGECAKCGRRFIRRAVDASDDGSLCLDCYKDWKESR